MATESPQYDRSAQNVGNIVALEHVNVTIPDQRLATIFYVMGMGFTRDPYLNVGDGNMWINVGQQQFHLPTQEPQVLRGHVGIVVPDLPALARRLDAVRDKLAGTRFGCTERQGCLIVTCPWGNILRCHPPGPRFGDLTLGMPYVEFSVGEGAAAGIAQFYRSAFGVESTLAPQRDCAVVPAGGGQLLMFREGATVAPYDGHHVAIYVADFGSPHRFLRDRGLVTEESSAHQYRFRQIVDPDSGAALFEIEHEVRSLKHPMWGRPFVNRNPAQTQRTYQRGHDAYYG